MAKKRRNTVLSTFKTKNFGMTMKENFNRKINARRIKMHEKPITAMT